LWRNLRLYVRCTHFTCDILLWDAISWSEQNVSLFDKDLELKHDVSSVTYFMDGPFNVFTIFVHSSVWIWCTAYFIKIDFFVLVLVKRAVLLQIYAEKSWYQQLNMYVFMYVGMYCAPLHLYSTKMWRAKLQLEMEKTSFCCALVSLQITGIKLSQLAWLAYSANFIFQVLCLLLHNSVFLIYFFFLWTSLNYAVLCLCI